MIRAQRSINDPIMSNNVNVNGTLHCLHLSHLNNVKKFIFISSSSVYKGVESKSLKEDMYLEPLHPYGVGKLAGEHYCRIYYNLFNIKVKSQYCRKNSSGYIHWYYDVHRVFISHCQY